MNENTTTTKHKGLKITGGVLGSLLLMGACTAAVTDDAPEGPDTPTAESTSAPGQDRTLEATRDGEIDPYTGEALNEGDDYAPARPENNRSLEERVFLAQVDQFQTPSEGDALLLGHTACHLLDEGTSIEYLVVEATSANTPVVPGFRNDELPRIYGVAIGSLCQQHMGQVAPYA